MTEAAPTLTPTTTETSPPPSLATSTPAPAETRTAEQIAADAAKTPEQIATEKAAAEAAKPAVAEFKPLVADQIKFAENFKVDDASRDAFLATLNDQKLAPEARAQALIDLHMKMSTQAAEAQTTQWNDLQKDWQSKVMADPDLGGAKFETTTQPMMSKVLDEFGSPEFRQLLDSTGMGNSVEFYKFVSKFAPHVLEGKAVNPGGGGQEKPSLATSLYPSMKNP